MKKSIFLVLLLVCGLQTSWAYSLAGPVGNGGDSWQQTVIGYGPPVDDIAPKNLGEEYRRNLPVMYYGFDQTFKDYFGTDGVAAVESAFNILNSLTNVDDYSTQLSEFPLETRQQNYQAQALGLLDLKSYVLEIMMEQLGLADPVHYSWTLHDRWHVGNVPCPVGMNYFVVQRNFDYVSSPLNKLQYSPYVNNTLYSYQIVEVCKGSPVLAQAVPFSVDPLADVYSPVASSAVTWGEYFTGLTRDDVAGLRYLIKTNNVNWESPAAGSVLDLITTNTALPEQFPPLNITNSVGTNSIGFYYFNGNTNGGIGYGDLAAFLGFISTNNQAAVQAAYPGVIVSSVTSTNVLATNETYSYSYTVPIGAPYGSVPVLTVTTNYYYYYQPHYTYTFDNVFTNHIYTNRAALVNVQVGPAIGSPYGSASQTNTTTTYTNQLAGDFFVFPPIGTNYCPLDILGSISNVVAYTNYLSVTDTNLVTANTNVASGSNTLSYSNSTYLVSYFTNYTFSIDPVTCTESTTNITGWYQGVGRMKFVRADFEPTYDPELGQYVQPVTNNYILMQVTTNNQVVARHFRRILTAPDFVFSAADLTTGPSSAIHANFLYSVAAPVLNTDNVLPGLAGPGTINPPTDVTFNKDGPVYYNSFGDVMDGTPYFNETPGGDVYDFFYASYFIWASFNGSTNAPVLYGNGTSMENLQNQILIKVTPKTLPNGFSDVPYPTQTFTATGGTLTQPYTWSATGLPAGLSLSTDGELSGTPTQTGTFDFTLKLTDYLGRSVQWGYTITIQ